MLSYQVQLDTVATINGLTIKRRTGRPVTSENLPRYVVFTPEGRALEEFRQKAQAVRWCHLTKNFLPSQAPGHKPGVQRPTAAWAAQPTCSW